jgi:hypothetical protein
MRQTHKILVEKVAGKRQLKRPSHVLEDNIKMNDNEIG